MRKPGGTGCLWPNGIGIESPAPIQGSAAASVWSAEGTASESAECFRTDILHSVGTLKGSWSLRIKYNDTHRSYGSFGCLWNHFVLGLGPCLCRAGGLCHNYFAYYEI